MVATSRMLPRPCVTGLVASHVSDYASFDHSSSSGRPWQVYMRHICAINPAVIPLLIK
jgi:hypothetical protein